MAFNNFSQPNQQGNFNHEPYNMQVFTSPNIQFQHFPFQQNFYNGLPMNENQGQNQIQVAMPMNNADFSQRSARSKYDIVGELDMTAQQYNLIFNQVMIWFGFDSSMIYTYDFNSHNWIQLPNPSGFKMLEYFRVAQLPDYSFMITGGSDGNNYSSMAVIFDNCQFIFQNNMFSPRRAHSTIYNDGYVYVFGGLRNNVTIKECERFSLASGFWETIEPMSTERSLTSVCNFDFEKIFIFGGYTTFGDKDIDLIEEFNTKVMKMRILPIRLHKAIENSMAVQVNDQEVVIFGGYSETESDLNTATALNIYTGAHSEVYKSKDIGWSIYPPFYKQGNFFLFVTGEEPNLPEVKIIDLH